MDSISASNATAPGLRAARRIAPLLFLIAAAFVAVVVIQLLPIRGLAPVKVRIQYATSPYLAQSWAFFAPYIPRETRIANLYIRAESDEGTREIGPLPIRALLLESGSPLAFQSRAANLTTLFEFNLWNPAGPLREPFVRLLSAAAAGVDRRERLGRIIAVRGTIVERRIAGPGQVADERESLALNTGWVPYEPEVDAW